MEKPVYIIAGIEKGGVNRETYESITFAKNLPDGHSPVIIVPGSNGEALARDLAGKSGFDTIALTGDHLDLYNSSIYCNAILEIIPRDTPLYICLAHTSFGYDLAPQLAVKLKAACITAIEKIEGNTLSRSVYSGRFTADMLIKTPSAVLTVLPGAFPSYLPTEAAAGKVQVVQAPKTLTRSRTLCVKESVHRDSTLTDAEVIVSAGRGVGKKDNIEIIKELAGLFPRSALGASRPACDLGYLDYSHQIGTTGQTVTPKLYIACGISGAIQHISGMKGALNIVAINTDPDAAIFRVAHYCVVEDLTVFIPLLIEEFKRLYG
jgi:electron transfer flavoprotein alpha subunit